MKLQNFIMPYYTYIITNERKTVLYIGVTNNLNRRMDEHWNNDGYPMHFSSKYGCKHLLYYEQFDSVETAIQREKELKKWRRDKKEALIQSTNPNFDFITTL